MTQAHPKWVYREGTEPDVRFSFANERTFLAWIRTSIALLAGGVALHTIDTGMGSQTQRALSGALVVLAMVCPPLAFLRWAKSERALRRSEPLPRFGVGIVFATALAGFALLVLWEIST